MVWTMSTSIVMPKKGSCGREIVVSIVISVVPCLAVLSGCSGNSHVEMEPPSSHRLSVEQERSMTAVLVEAAEGTPSSGRQMQLLPENGIRWSDAPLAMDKAADELKMAVLSRTTVDGDTMDFRLTSVQGWPAKVTVRRLDAEPWVSAIAIVGPWPESNGRDERAGRLESSFMQWMRKFGAMKRVEPWSRERE
tara:strand:- start:976 stop:1554 length:579 start_codon:yes stop_codon:yes gene_type:complete